jgi:hypothetical protein
MNTGQNTVIFFISAKEQFKINIYYLTLDNPITPLKKRFTSLNYINSDLSNALGGQMMLFRSYFK